MMKLLLFYTDPGSGMMLLQILLAFGASAMFYFRKYVYRLFGRTQEGSDGGSPESFAEDRNDGQLGS